MSEAPKLELRFSTKEEFEKEYTENLSKGGIFIATADPPPLRSKVEFNIFAPDRETPITLTGEVVHVIGADQQIPGMEPGVALQILDYNDEVDQKLKGIISGESEPGQQEPAEKEAAPEETEEGQEDPEAEEDKEKEEKKVERTVAGFKGLNSDNLFSSVRKLPRNEQISLAKRGPRNVLNVLVQIGDKQIMRFLIQNPRLSIPDILQILKSPQVPLEIIQAIGKNSGWMQSDEVRYVLVTNPKTPLPLALNQLKGLNMKNLAMIAKSRNVKMQLKSNALKLLELRRSGSKGSF